MLYGCLPPESFPLFLCLPTPVMTTADEHALLVHGVECSLCVLTFVMSEGEVCDITMVDQYIHECMYGIKVRVENMSAKGRLNGGDGGPICWMIQCCLQRGTVTEHGGCFDV